MVLPKYRIAKLKKKNEIKKKIKIKHEPTCT